MGRIVAVGWDMDRVWYESISTSYCAEDSTRDPKPYLDRFLSDGLFTEGDIDLYAALENIDPEEATGSIPAIAGMLTAFLYRITKPDSGDSVLAKQQVIEGKQSLLEGLTMGEIIRIADRVELTPGLRRAIGAFRSRSKDNGGPVYQAAFSDGFGPFIAYLARRERVDYCEAAQAIMEAYGHEYPFDNTMLGIHEAAFTGRSLPYDKSRAFLAHMRSRGIPLANVATIDDSAANIPMMKKVQEAGGVAIAFNPTEAHKPQFEEAGITILAQTERTLEPFQDIVLDPSEATIGRYC